MINYIRQFLSRSRIGRIEYLTGNVVIFVAMVAAMMLVIATKGDHPPADGVTMDFVMVPMILVIVVLSIAQIRLSVQRLHDMNDSGWWLVPIMAISAIPYIGFLLYLVLFFGKGTTGANKYGLRKRSAIEA